MSRTTLIIVSVLLTALLAACGGSKGGGGDANASGEAKVELTGIQKLEKVSADLQAGIEQLMQPINDVHWVVDQLTSMPARLNIDAKSLMGMAKATMDSGQIAISADLNLAAEAQAEVQALLDRIRAIVAGLQATPERVKLLGAQAAAAMGQVPVLAMGITTAAQAKLANPLASAESKAQAQADLQAVVGVQASVEAQIQDVQNKIMGIPALATEALAKLAASFAGGASM
jgi:predicted small secreted protein